MELVVSWMHSEKNLNNICSMIIYIYIIILYIYIYHNICILQYIIIYNVRSTRWDTYIHCNLNRMTIKCNKHEDAAFVYFIIFVTGVTGKASGLKLITSESNLICKVVLTLLSFLFIKRINNIWISIQIWQQIIRLSRVKQWMPVNEVLIISLHLEQFWE